MNKVLTIAGSDCSGGAGIQADLKTITVHNMYGMSVITALTAQNTTGVYEVMEVPPELVGRQLDCVFQDIRPEAVKIGMVANARIIEVIVERLNYYQAQNIVIDPVMISTSGHRLLSPEAMEGMMNRLLPLGRLLTPNLAEAECLTGRPIQKTADISLAAGQLAERFKTAVLIKGGHKTGAADDYLYDGTSGRWFRAKRLANPNTHGTGCTLSAAIACQLAAGHSLEQSIAQAKAYLTDALAAGLNLGAGPGPLNHNVNNFVKTGKNFE